MPASKQFARTNTYMLLNPLMPFTGIVSPPRKFLVSTKVVRLGRCCKFCNADDRFLKPFPPSARYDRDLKSLKVSGISPTRSFLARFRALNSVHNAMPGGMSPVRLLPL